MKKLLFVLIAGAVFCSVADAMAQMPDRPRVTGGTVTPSEPADVSQSRERGDDWRDGWMLGIGPLGGVPLNNGCESCSQSPAFG